MNYWIFTVTVKRSDNKEFSAEEIFDTRMQDEFWGIGEKTPNRKNLRKGDKVIFYVGLPNMTFSGTTKLLTECKNLNDNQLNKYSHGLELYSEKQGVFLTDIDIWKNPKNVKDLVPHLSFIENKKYWFSYLQGGIRQIPEHDFLLLMGERDISLAEQLSKSKDIESESEFALEEHLEEFLYKNWDSINWGMNLDLYKVEDQSGRQFPAGQWSIDFLARDRDSNDFVVIELKRGKTSDAVVGQLLRYINWIRTNVAEKGQGVKGIIVANDYDESLTYSVMSSPDIEVMTYKINFKLSIMEK